MKKLLSVSVAAYNVEKYLDQTLSSLSGSKYLDKLEIFVIDDGGTDNSLQIAKSYEERYPQSFYSVHKENGGYGSTVNYSIQHASGKYFKLLDGDDWMNTAGLDAVLEKLEYLEEDVIITDFYIGLNRDDMKIHSTRNEDNNVIPVKEYKTDFPHGMWAIFYKTDLLRRCGLRLPGHVPYTDQLYSTIPFATADTIRFLNTPVYCYRYGTQEQSTSCESRKKHCKEMLKICKTLYDFYELHKEDQNCYLFSRVSRYYIVALRTLLLFPVNKKNQSRIAAYEAYAKEHYPDLYKAAADHSLMGQMIQVFRNTNYAAYWGVKFIPMSLLNQ